MLEMPYSNTQKIIRKINEKRRTSNRTPKLLNCHICAQQWDSQNRCFVCPNCHTVYNPQIAKTGLSGEIRLARAKMNMNQPTLAKIIGCNIVTLIRIEKDKPCQDNVRTRMIKERLRIWVESTKSPIDRRKEIDNMFKENESA